jgi:hypothetical protein
MFQWPRLLGDFVGASTDSGPCIDESEAERITSTKGSVPTERSAVYSRKIVDMLESCTRQIKSQLNAALKDPVGVRSQ